MSSGPFEEAGQNLIAAGLAGMYLVAGDMMVLSQEQVPVDTGTLKNSAALFLQSDGVTIGYGYSTEINPKTGRMAAEYAVPVHEILEAHHAPPTKAKFLEDPVMLLSSQLGPTMGFFMSRAQFEKGQPMSMTLEERVIGVLTQVPSFGGGFTLRGAAGRFVGAQK